MPSPRPICFPDHHSSGPDCAPFVLSSSANVSLVPPVLQAQGLDWVLPWPFPLCLPQVPRNLLETWAEPGSVSWLESSLRLWKNKISFQVNLLFQLLYLLVIQVLNFSTNTSLCVCVCVCVSDCFHIFSISNKLALRQVLYKDCFGEKEEREKKKAFFFFPDSTHYMIPFDLCLHFFLSTKIFILSVIYTGDSFPRYDIDEGRGFCAYPMDASRRLIALGQHRGELWTVSLKWKLSIKWGLTLTEEEGTHADSTPNSLCDLKAHCFTFVFCFFFFYL